jgi:hypothetical protein
MIKQTTERITAKDYTDIEMFLQETGDLTTDLIKYLDVRIQIARTKKELPNRHSLKTMLRLRILLKKYQIQLNSLWW